MNYKTVFQLQMRILVLPLHLLPLLPLLLLLVLLLLLLCLLITPGLCQGRCSRESSRLGFRGGLTILSKEKVGHDIMQGDYIALLIGEGHCITVDPRSKAPAYKALPAYDCKRLPAYDCKAFTKKNQ